MPSQRPSVQRLDRQLVETWGPCVCTRETAGRKKKSFFHQHPAVGNRQSIGTGIFLATGTMIGRFRKRIYVLEKEPQFRAMLETSLTPHEASISGFASHRECVDTLATRPCDLLIVDLDGCEPQGLDMLEQARRMTPWVASLAIVEHAGVSCAIRAVKAGVGDCLDKPVEPERLLATVRTRLARVDTSARRRPRALTPMEIQILQLILAGRTSFEIADELHRSKRTVDVHRKNIMRKLQATGLVDLIKRALGMGFADYPTSAQDRSEDDQSEQAGPTDTRPRAWEGIPEAEAGLTDPEPDEGQPSERDSELDTQ